MKKEFPISEKHNWSPEQEGSRGKLERVKNVLVEELARIAIQALQDNVELADLDNKSRAEGLLSEIKPLLDQLKGEGSDRSTVFFDIEPRVLGIIKEKVENDIQYVKAGRIYKRLARHIIEVAPYSIPERDSDGEQIG